MACISCAVIEEGGRSGASDYLCAIKLGATRCSEQLLAVVGGALLVCTAERLTHAQLLLR